MKHKKYVALAVVVLLLICFVTSGKAGEIIQVVIGGGYLEVLTINYTNHSITTFQYNYSADSDFNMNNYNIFNVNRLNTTEICIGTDCQSIWPSSYNYTYDSKVSFPGFTDLLTDYSFTDNSIDWDTWITNYTTYYTFWRNQTQDTLIYANTIYLNQSAINTNSTVQNIFGTNQTAQALNAVIQFAMNNSNQSIQANNSNHLNGNNSEFYNYRNNNTLTDRCVNNTYALNNTLSNYDDCLKSFIETDPFAYNGTLAYNDTLSAYDTKLDSYTETDPLAYNGTLARNDTLSAYDTCLQSFTESDPEAYNGSLAYNSTLSAYDSKVSFPGFTSLLTDYSFTDNSVDWNTWITNYTTYKTFWRNQTQDTLIYANTIYLNQSAINANSTVQNIFGTNQTAQALNAVTQFAMNNTNQSITANNSNHLNGQASSFFLNNTKTFIETNNASVNNVIATALTNNTGINATILYANKVVSGVYCFFENCTSNITNNGTHTIW